MQTPAQVQNMVGACHQNDCANKRSGEVDVKVAAARAGWWNLGQPELEALAGHPDIDLTGGNALVDILQTMTKT
eukprot:630540-Prorocentrum_lima.AAC.1